MRAVDCERRCALVPENSRDSEWILEDVRRSELSQQGVVLRANAREAWPASFGPELFELTSARVDSLSSADLAHYIAYLRANRLETAAYELERWKKAAHPLATAVMVVLAVPLVLGRLGGGRSGSANPRRMPDRGDVPRRERDLGPGRESCTDSPPALGALAPTLAFLAAGAWLLRRLR